MAKKKIDQCQASNVPSQDCQVVYKAAADFLVQLNYQQTNPLGFGQTLMQAEQNCVNAKIRSDTLSTVKTDSKEKEQAKENSLKYCQQVEVMLAVLGLNKPE